MKTIATGVKVSDNGQHCYYHLSSERNQAIHPIWRKRTGVYEEDCELAIVLVTHPDILPDYEADKRHANAKCWFPDEYELIYSVTVTADESIVRRDQIFRQEHACDWVGVAAWGDWHENVPTGYVGVAATLAGSRQAEGYHARYFIVPSEEYAARERGAGFVIDLGKHAEWVGPNKVTASVAE